MVFRKFKLVASLMLIGSLLLIACAPAATPEAPEAAPEAEATEEMVEEEPTEEPTEEPMEEEEPAEEEMMEEEEEAADPTIAQTAASLDEFSTLVAAVEAAGLTDTLNGEEEEFTVFAPTNAAFEAAFEELGITAEDLLADTELLNSILLYHVLPGTVTSEEVLEQNLLTTVEGSLAVAYVTEEGPYINNAGIIQPDVSAANGVIHVINSVLLPPSFGYETDAEQSIAEIAAGNEDFSTLVAALDAAGLVGVLSDTGTYTVFAPTNAAFEAAFEALGITAEDLLADTDLLTDILLYHVTLGGLRAEDVVAVETLPMLNGDLTTISAEGGAFINEATIVTTDIEASNGVIHVIDAVIVPPADE